MQQRHERNGVLQPRFLFLLVGRLELLFRTQPLLQVCPESGNGLETIRQHLLKRQKIGFRNALARPRREGVLIVKENDRGRRPGVSEIQAQLHALRIPRMLGNDGSIRRGRLRRVRLFLGKKIVEVKKMIEGFPVAAQEIAKAFPVKAGVRLGNDKLLELPLHEGFHRFVVVDGLPYGHHIERPPGVAFLRLTGRRDQAEAKVLVPPFNLQEQPPRSSQERHQHQAVALCLGHQVGKKPVGEDDAAGPLLVVVRLRIRKLPRQRSEARRRGQQFLPVFVHLVFHLHVVENGRRSAGLSLRQPHRRAEKRPHVETVHDDLRRRHQHRIFILPRMEDVNPEQSSLFHVKGIAERRRCGTPQHGIDLLGIAPLQIVENDGLRIFPFIRHDRQHPVAHIAVIRPQYVFLHVQLPERAVEADRRERPLDLVQRLRQKARGQEISLPEKPHFERRQFADIRNSVSRIPALRLRTVNRAEPYLRSFRQFLESHLFLFLHRHLPLLYRLPFFVTGSRPLFLLSCLYSIFLSFFLLPFFICIANGNMIQ